MESDPNQYLFFKFNGAIFCASNNPKWFLEMEHDVASFSGFLKEPNFYGHFYFYEGDCSCSMQVLAVWDANGKS